MHVSSVIAPIRLAIEQFMPVTETSKFDAGLCLPHAFQSEAARAESALSIRER